MNRTVIALAVVLASAITARAQTQATPTRVPIVFLELADDARYEPVRAFGRFVLKALDHPYAGAQVGIEDARPLTRASGADHQLERITANSIDDMVVAIIRSNDAGVAWFLLDAPAEAEVPADLPRRRRPTRRSPRP